MAFLTDTVDLAVGDETVGAFDECSSDNLAVLQNIISWDIESYKEDTWPYR